MIFFNNQLRIKKILPLQLTTRHEAWNNFLLDFCAPEFRKEIQNTMHLEQTLSSGEKITLVSSGHFFFRELERLINETQEEIHLQIYIFEPDETGSRIANALLQAALRGVKIFLLVDAFGSANFPASMQKQLQDAGVKMKRYGPLFESGTFHIGRRLHRKVIVFDRKKAIVAGLNLSNNYNDTPAKKAWLDFAVFVEGNIVARLYAICLQRWIRKPMRMIPLKKILSAKKTFSSIVRVRQNDMLRGLNEANASCRREIKNATESLFIVGGYFLPGGRVRRLLRHAVSRGVTVKIILAAESDVTIQRNAIQYLYHWMLRHHIQIYEYQPSNVHGKALVADKKIVLVGSYDMNNLSTYSNIELNLDIPNERLAAAFHDELEKIAASDCRLVSVEELYRRTNLWTRFTHWLSYQSVKSLFMLATWLARADDDEYQ
jgi:cardiolipin synthase A/B